MFKLNVNDQNSGFKAFSKEAADNMNFDPDGFLGLHRFILPLAHVNGYSVLACLRAVSAFQRMWLHSVADLVPLCQDDVVRSMKLKRRVANPGARQAGFPVKIV